SCTKNRYTITPSWPPEIIHFPCSNNNSFNHLIKKRTIWCHPRRIYHQDRIVHCIVIRRNILKHVRQRIHHIPPAYFSVSETALGTSSEPRAVTDPDPSRVSS